MPDESARVSLAQSDDGRSSRELIEGYRSGGAALRGALAEMSAEQLLARPIEGRMSTLEVVGHLCDCEQFLADRMKRTVATDRPLLIGVDGSRYVHALTYQQRALEPQLALIDATRAQMAEDFDRLPESAWSRSAVHSETGLVTVRQLLLHAINHMTTHIAAIREKREALGLE